MSENKPSRQDEFEETITRNFDFLFQGENYQIVHKAPFGRYKTETIIGVHAENKPSFQFYRETGPEILVGPPLAPMNYQIYFEGIKWWWSMAWILDFIHDRPGQALRQGGKFVDSDSGFQEFSKAIQAVWSQLLEMFENQEMVTQWDPTYEQFVQQVFADHRAKLDQMRKDNKDGSS